MFELNTRYSPPTYSVSEISQNIKRSLEDIFSDLKIKGEISGLKIPDSGHVYFNLKDENSVINAVCWKGNFKNISFRPEDGMEVIVSGNITSFPGRSNYQINVKSFEIAGVGELLKKLEERKRKFKAQGLFDEHRKKPLPLIPKSIGIITSPTGAVIKDIMHRINDRFPLNVKVWPVPVQGFESTDKIAAAIKGFNNLPSNIEAPEVIILARGGGSLEDLWCFNEEAIVLAIAESKIPIISAIGHETDFTLADYVADVRAPTPTAAAEISTPVKQDLIEAVKLKSSRINKCIQNIINYYSQRLIYIKQKLKSFSHKVINISQEITTLQNRINTALKFFIVRKTHTFTNTTNRLTTKKLKYIQNFSQEFFSKTYKSIQLSFKRIVKLHEITLDNNVRLINSFNHKSVLSRGYAIVRDANKHILKTKEAALKNNKVSVLFSDGELSINLKSSKNNSPKPTQIDMFEDK